MVGTEGRVWLILRDFEYEVGVLGGRFIFIYVIYFKVNSFVVLVV